MKSNFIRVHDINIYDGDSFRATVRGMGRFKEFGTQAPFRIDGIDTPELRGKCPEEKEFAREARDYVRDLVSNFGKKSYVEIKGKDKYGRFLVDLHVGDFNVGEHLITLGYAYGYDGGTKESWCERLKKINTN